MRPAGILAGAFILFANPSLVTLASDTQPVHATWTCQYTGARKTVASMPGKNVEQKKKKVVKRWIAALKSKDAATRTDATIALGELKSALGVEPLVKALHDPEPIVRACADESLVAIGPPAVNPLINALRDNDQWVPVLSAEALSSIPTQSARDALITALNAGNDKVILGAHTLFVRLGIPGSETTLSLTLDHYPNREMAQEFYNSGNQTLVYAARRWATNYRQRLIVNNYGTAVHWASGAPLFTPVRDAMAVTPPPSASNIEQASTPKHRHTLDEAVNQ